MSEGYFVANDFESEVIIKRSRFLTIVRGVSDEDSAIAVLSEIKAKYGDATHVCYAYRTDGKSFRTRFSDAGEPQGTAGKPILDALIAEEVSDTLIAVVRYFGGVKLGAGGLTRAYRSCAADTLKEGGKTRYEKCERVRITCALSGYNAVTRIVESMGAFVLERSFSSQLEAELAAVASAEPLIKALTDTFKGAIEAEILGSEYIPLPNKD